MGKQFIVIRDLRTGYAVNIEDACDGILIGDVQGVGIYHVRTLTKAKARDVLVACLPVIASLMNTSANMVRYAGVTSPTLGTSKRSKANAKQLKLL